MVDPVEGAGCECGAAVRAVFFVGPFGLPHVLLPVRAGGEDARGGDDGQGGGYLPVDGGAVLEALGGCDDGFVPEALRSPVGAERVEVSVLHQGMLMHPLGGCPPMVVSDPVHAPRGGLF